MNGLDALYDHQDAMLKELLLLEADVKVKNKRIAEIKEWCREMGSFATDRFLCSVKEHERRGMVGLDKAIQLVGKDTLEEFGLITASTYKTVHVSEIGAV